MIRDESRMREIRTSGSTSGGVETDRMGAGLSTQAKARTRSTGPYPAPRHPPTLLQSLTTPNVTRDGYSPPRYTVCSAVTYWSGVAR